MKIENGIIHPGVSIGSFNIGAKREDVTLLLKGDYRISEREDGTSFITGSNFKFWFNEQQELDQIGVTEGFLGDYQSIHIGSTMQDVFDKFGAYEDDGYVYLISGIDGICFELKDVDDWEELTAPIKWIFVYKN